MKRIFKILSVFPLKNRIEVQDVLTGKVYYSTQQNPVRFLKHGTFLTLNLKTN